MAQACAVTSVPSSRCLSLSNVSLGILAEPMSHAKWLLVKIGLGGQQKQNEPSMASLPPFITGKWHAQLKKPQGSHFLVAHFVCLSSSVFSWLWQATTPCKASHDPCTLHSSADKRKLVWGQQGIFCNWLSILGDKRNLIPQEEMACFILLSYCFVLFYFIFIAVGNQWISEYYDLGTSLINKINCYCIFFYKLI